MVKVQRRRIFVRGRWDTVETPKSVSWQGVSEDALCSLWRQPRQMRHEQPVARTHQDTSKHRRPVAGKKTRFRTRLIGSSVPTHGHNLVRDVQRGKPLRFPIVRGHVVQINESIAANIGADIIEDG
jgi:hypothetical protein